MKLDNTYITIYIQTPTNICHICMNASLIWNWNCMTFKIKLKISMYTV